MRNGIVLLLCSLIIPAKASNFTIINGQIFTPGLAIIDAPQPNTPLGGDHLQVAIDISGDGKLQLPPYPANALTAFYNITIFLSSYVTGLNLTITNGTAGSGNASLGDILAQEPGSTVKHVNWIWPDCFVGNGPPIDSNSARGVYNISLHQSFILNTTTYYTIFDLPISITNSIPASAQRPSCDILENTLLSQAALDASADTIPPGQYPWTDGRGTQTVVPDEGGATSTESGSASSSGSGGASSSASAVATSTGTAAGSSTATGTEMSGSAATVTESSGSSSSSAATSAPYFGDPKPDATPEDGLGSGTALEPNSMLLQLLLALALVLYVCV